MISTLTPARGGVFVPETMDLSQRLRLWADELRAIANEGLHWDGANPYNVWRFQRVRRIAAEVFAAQDIRAIDTIELYEMISTEYE